MTTLPLYWESLVSLPLMSWTVKSRGEAGLPSFDAAGDLVGSLITLSGYAGRAAKSETPVSTTAPATRNRLRSFMIPPERGRWGLVTIDTGNRRPGDGAAGQSAKLAGSRAGSSG